LCFKLFEFLGHEYLLKIIEMKKISEGKMSIDKSKMRNVGKNFLETNNEQCL